jgi:hypothetical protein
LNPNSEVENEQSGVANESYFLKYFFPLYRGRLTPVLILAPRNRGQATTGKQNGCHCER